MLKKINHVIVGVKDLDEALNFWSGRVGLGVKLREGVWVELETEGTTLALHRVETTTPGETGISFWVEDVQGVYEELSRRGVKFTRRPEKQPWGGTLAVFQDDEGNSFTIEGPGA